MHSDMYVRNSLELHLFFGRIMKEHALFLKAGFTPANPAFIRQAELYQRQFEQLLCRAIRLSGGRISKEVLCSGELVTELTEQAEHQTEGLTAIPIDRSITREELRLVQNCQLSNNVQMNVCTIRELNRQALALLNGFITFQEHSLDCVLQCKLFTTNYPQMLEHLIREAKLYCQCVQRVEQEGNLCGDAMEEVECFWNEIMMEHAQFIRGLLDPAETELFCTADEFAKEYAELLENCRQNCSCQPTQETTLEKTVRLRDFKQEGAQGIQNCQIRSAILPLLADHVLREANHYIRLLECAK